MAPTDPDRVTLGEVNRKVDGLTLDVKALAASVGRLQIIVYGTLGTSGAALGKALLGG